MPDFEFTPARSIGAMVWIALLMAALVLAISNRQHMSSFVFAENVAASFLLLLPPAVGSLAGRPWLGLALGLGMGIVIPFLVHFLALQKGWVTFP